MPSFDDFFDELLDQLALLAQSRWKEFQQAALVDARTFANKARKDLEGWTRKLADGELSPADFEWLVIGKKDLAEMEALKQAGLAQVRIDRFRMSVVDTIIGTAFKIFL